MLESVTMRAYLHEDGNGEYARYRVPDLVPPAGIVCELVIVLESPHSDELRTGIPMSGSTGQAALQFLAPSGRPPEALGPFIASLHANGDFRVSIINSSPVPLQEKAFNGHQLRPDLSPSEWNLLKAIQASQKDDVADLSTTAEQEANQMLWPGLQSRFEHLTMTEDTKIFLAGIVVQRTWALLAKPPSQTTLAIPHPSNGWWTRTKRKEWIANLSELRKQFAITTP